jgi:ribosomal protein S18 acetylase RimI-like enzyme
MLPVTIRFATIDDAELIAELSRQTFYETFAASNTKADMDKFMNETFSKETLMKEVGTGENIFLLAYDGEEAVGYVKMREGEVRPEFSNKPSIEIARIYAIHSSIGKGVGKILMQKCIDIALENKKEIIWLGVWEKNDRAITFYQKFGFEKFATHDFVLGNDVQTDWLMKKGLFHL